MNSGGAQKLKSQSGIFLVIFLGIAVLALFYTLWIRPALHSLEQIDRRIAELELLDERQTRLLPLYARLSQESFLEISEALTIPEKLPLPRESVTEISPAFRDFAERSGLTMISVTPQLRSIEAAPGRLVVDAVMAGHYSAMGSFVLLLSQLPYLERIETISVRQTGAGAGEKQLNLKIWLLVM